MKIIDLYIAKKFLVTVIFMFGITTVISVIFDISEKMGDFLNRNIPIRFIIFDYYLSFIPNIINLLSPIIIFLAALYFTSRLANNTEILAVLSSGTSYYRILRPYIAVALLMALVDLGMKNFLIPKSYSKQIKFEYSYIDGEYKAATNIHVQYEKNAYFYAQSIDNQNKRASDFCIEKFSEGKLIYKLKADDAIYDEKAKNWTAHNYYIRTINGMHETLVRGDSMRVKTPNLAIDDFIHKVKSMPSMTTPELNTFIENAKMKGDQDINFYLVEKYRRLSMPADIIVLVLIAVSLASRKVRGGLGVHLITGILIALTQVMFVRFSTTFATNGSFPPLLAVFLPTIFYGCIAFYLIKTTPK